MKVRRILSAIGILLLLSCAGLFVVYSSLPNPAEFRERNPADSAFMRKKCAADACHPLWVPLEQISPFLIRAVILAEDRNFFLHSGWDWKSLSWAIQVNLRAGRILWGGSTISMQLAKNLYLSPEKTLTRKLKEWMLTYKLERELSKQRILELYVNLAQWGPSTFGIGSAAREYFDKEAGQLTPFEAAYLASILPNPELSRDLAFREQFRLAGERIFMELVLSHLPLGTEATRAQLCADPLVSEDAARADLMMIKIFNQFAHQLLDGSAALLSREEVLVILSEQEREWVESIEQRAGGENDAINKLCLLTVKDRLKWLVTVTGIDAFGMKRQYWIPKSMVIAVNELIAQARAQGLRLGIQEAYYDGGYQLYLFLTELRHHGYCVAKTLKKRHTEQPHQCLDYGAIDFRDGEISTGRVNSVADDRTSLESWLFGKAPLHGFSHGENDLEPDPWHWRYRGSPQMQD